MANPRVEATYARAMAAFQEGSFDAARRLIGEILIDDPGHAGARALRTRLEARMSSAASGRSGHTPAPGSFRPAHGGRGTVPEATSVDPTVLIDRASSSAFEPPEYIEPTVVVQREDVERYRAAAREAPLPSMPPPSPPSSRPSRSAPAPEPTILIPPKRSAASADSRSSGGLVQRVWRAARGDSSSADTRRPSSRNARARSQQRGLANPMTRGLVMVLGGVIVAALFVAASIWVYRVFFPQGHVLTVTRPEGGTIVGGGLECGTGGSDCSITKADNETVELQPVPDSGYLFTGFTGDCEKSRRLVMTQARTCGATFGRVAPQGPGATWPLTILKPAGGTIVTEGIICGKLGDQCSATIPDGTKVTLNVETEEGFQLLQYTGDCSPLSGETTMSAARTCSATFQPTTKPIANPTPDRRPDRLSASGGGGRTGAGNPVGVTSPPPATVGNPVPSSSPSGQQQNVQAPAVQPQGVPPPSGQTPAPTGQTGLVSTTPNPGEVPKVGITPEEHAKKEILQLVKDYCSAMDSLQPDRLKKLYPQVDVALHRELFKQYKSLKCSLVGDPEYDRFDASSAGGAQLKIGMKQQVEMKSGGAPKALETIATFIVSRMNNSSPWYIDRLQVVAKPK